MFEGLVETASLLLLMFTIFWTSHGGWFVTKLSYSKSHRMFLRDYQKAVTIINGSWNNLGDTNYNSVFPTAEPE